MPSRIQRLVDRYSADLQRFAPDWRQHFACPLCCRVFAIAPDVRDTLAEEHILSRQLGGRIVTLTCRACNSQHGAKLDAHLVQRVRIEANKRPMKVRFKMGTASMGAEMDAMPKTVDPIEIRAVAKQSDPRQIEELQRILLEGNTKIDLHMSLGYNENRSMVALVRAAYLLMFRTFGYRYVFDPSAAPVRRQLQDPVQRTPILDGVIWRIPAAIPVGSSLAIMHSPESTRSFFVILSLDQDSGHVAGVALPPPGTDGSELYQRLRLPEFQGPKTLHPLPLPKHGFFPFGETWRYVLDQVSTDNPPVS